MTGITETALLRASHIVPWAECTDEKRLDVHNGVLLSALWDAAFDRGLISFTEPITESCWTNTRDKSVSEEGRRPGRCP
jgi:predicted restriction endonuclease